MGGKIGKPLRIGVCLRASYASVQRTGTRGLTDELAEIRNVDTTDAHV